MSEIKRAIALYGEKSNNVAVKSFGNINEVAVYVEGEYYGIYFFTKNTFVD